jgi:hypothetical protein
MLPSPVFGIMFLLSALNAASVPVQVQVDLGGSSWTVASSNGSVTANATVPGQVHTDLFAAGLIPEPFAGFNELDLRWVALENWTFSRRFTAPAAALASSDGNVAAAWSAQLVFDGLDTIANVTLNGRLLGISVNSFVRWQASLPAGLLHAGDDANELVVRFTCAQAYGQTAAAAYPVPLREFRANRYSYSGRPWVRKSQTHFGWNWGPGFITQGIHRPVSLQLVRRSVGSVDSVLVQQAAVPSEAEVATGGAGAAAHGRDARAAAAAAATSWPPLPLPPPTTIALSLGVEVRCAPSDAPSALQLLARLGNSNSTTAAAVQAAEPVMCPASEVETLVSASLRLQVPVGSGGGGGALALWYPNGYGAQALHNLTVRLCAAASAGDDCALPWTSAVG